MGEPFSGAVLTGGASRRMGSDKAFLVVDGLPLAVRTAGVLGAAGAREVVAIGGNGPALVAMGLSWRPDRHPGEGPLGGIITALAESPRDLVVVVATDLVALDRATVTAVLDGLGPDDDVAMAATERLEPLCAAWRRRALPTLAAAFASGDRAVHLGAGELVVAPVPVDPAKLRNANRPSDLVSAAPGDPAADAASEGSGRVGRDRRGSGR